MEEVAVELGISRSAAYALAKEDPSFPAFRAGRSIRVRKNRLVSWQEAGGTPRRRAIAVKLPPNSTPRQLARRDRRLADVMPALAPVLNGGSA